MASMTGAIVAWRYGKATIWRERERKERGERESNTAIEREERERKRSTTLVIIKMYYTNFT